MILQGEIVLTNVNDGINGKDGTNGKDGVNPVFYRLVQNGDGICNASLTPDSNNKLQVQISVSMGFFVYKYQGDSAERLTDVSGFNVEGYLYNAEEAVTVRRGNDGTFVLTYRSTVSGDDMDDYATLKVVLRDTNGKIWDSVTIPVTIDNGNYYARTESMMESIYANQGGLSEITQRADRISAMVYSHGRNLLYDAGFADSTPTLEGTMGQRRFQTSAGNTVTVNGDGTLTITAAGNTTAQYTGVYWYVPIQATGYYTASVEVLSGTTVTDGSFAIYTATLDRTQEQNMIGYNAIKTSDVGKRVTVTTNNELTEADFGKYLEVYVVVPTNGTIKIKCPQLERGKEATTWTLRGVEDGLVKAGVNVEAGKVNLYADRTTLYNSKGKEVAVFDSEGNLLAGSLTCTKDGLTANVKPGEASFLKSGSALGIRIGIIDGSPALYATNENGAVTWKLSIDYGTTTSDTAALSALSGDGFAAYTTNGSLSNPQHTGVKVSAYGTITIKNTSTVMHTYDGNNISIKVDNLWGTGTKNESCDVNLGNTGSVGVNGIGSMGFDIMATTSSTDITNFPFSPWQATVHVLYLGNEIGSGKVTMRPDFS